ncbi:MAG: histidinol-phosphatase HisJ family protein [Ktedonobacteraceae bacterium]
MILDTDFHSHIVRSSALQMAQSAHERGIRVLGLSEHVFQMSEARAPLAHMELEGPILSFQEYIDAAHAAGEQAEVDVRLGLEVDFIPEQNDTIQASLQGYPWDFLIGSVHQVDGKLFERDNKLTREQGEATWLRYMQLLREAVQSNFFSLVSHPVRMRYKNPYLPPRLEDEYEQLAALATQKNTALEINGYDTLTYPDMVRLLAKACALHNTPISVGSDAHNPKQVAQAHTQTLEILREVGIAKLRIWKQRVPEEYLVV